MEIAVARDSPLGQYLAGAWRLLCANEAVDPLLINLLSLLLVLGPLELDGEVGDANLAAGLLPAVPSRSPTAARRRPRAAATFDALYSEFKSLVARLLLQSELRMLGVVYEALDAAWPAWRCGRSRLAFLLLQLD
jgi:hypothetical protein